MGISWISDTPHDGDGDLLHTDLSVNSIYRTNQSGGIAGGKLEEILSKAFIIISVTMEEDIGDLVLLATLEDCLDTMFDIKFFILGTDSTWGCIKGYVDILK